MTVTALGNLSSAASASLLVAEFEGAASAGNVSVPGVKEGDIILTFINTSDVNYEVPNRNFRSVAPADDTIYQGAGGFNGMTILAVILRPG